LQYCYIELDKIKRREKSLKGITKRNGSLLKDFVLNY